MTEAICLSEQYSGGSGQFTSLRGHTSKFDFNAQFHDRSNLSQWAVFSGQYSGGSGQFTSLRGHTSKFDFNAQFHDRSNLSQGAVGSGQYSVDSIQRSVVSLRHCEGIRVSLILRLTFVTEAICLREQWSVFSGQYSGSSGHFTSLRGHTSKFDFEAHFHDRSNLSQGAVGSIQWAVFREQWSVYVIARSYE
jgi:hypothetical protein